MTQEVTVLSTTLDKYNSAKQKSADHQRFLWFQKKIERNALEVTVTKTDKHLIYAHYSYKIKFGKQLFKLRTNYKGFSYCYETKKLKVWFGTSLPTLNCIHEFLKLQKLEFAKDFSEYLTKGLLEKMLQGKITNPYDAMKHIIKTNRFQKTTSPKFMYNWIKENKGSRPELYTAFYNAKDINQFLLEKPAKVDNYLFNYLFKDMAQQAAILQEKIDYKWSFSRMKEVHKEWTRKIMKMELQFIDDFKLEYYNLPKLPPEIEVINSQTRLFEEGSTMDHCVYTNYLENWKEKDYMVMHCSYKGEHVTIGLNKIALTLELDQCYTTRNENPSACMQVFLDSKLTKSVLRKLYTSLSKAKTCVSESV